MPHERAPWPARRPDPEARIHIAFTVPEATMLYALMCVAYEVTGRGTRVTSTEAGPGDAAVLDRATCKLYTGLRDTCGNRL